MNKLNPQNELFLELENTPPVWWENILSEKDVYVEIRKNNYTSHMTVWFYR